MRIFSVLVMWLVELAAFPATVVSIPSVYFGVGFFIIPALIFFLIMNASAAINVVVNGSMSARRFKWYVASVILAAIACAGGSFVLASLSGIDDSSDEATNAAGLLTAYLAVDLVVTVALIGIAYYWHRRVPEIAVEPVEQIKGSG